MVTIGTYSMAASLFCVKILLQVHPADYASPVRSCQFAVRQKARHLTETRERLTVSCVCLLAAAAASTVLGELLARRSRLCACDAALLT